MLDRIIRRTEAAFPPALMDRPRRGEVSFPQAISDSAAFAARELRARAIVAFTQSGSTARLISQDRPPVPIIAFTPSERVRRRLALDWGVIPRLIQRLPTIDGMVAEIESDLLADRTVKYNDILIIVSGAPLWVRGTVNLLKLHRVGEHRYGLGGGRSPPPNLPPKEGAGEARARSGTPGGGRFVQRVAPGCGG
jgi:pyruvate kinase